MLKLSFVNKHFHFLSFLSYTLLGLLLLSCQDTVVGEKNVDLPESAWAKDALAHISMDAPNENTANDYRLIINLRHSEDYPYRNIFLFITTTAPDGAAIRDTVEYELANESGQWLGKVGRYWIDHRLLYRSHIRFPQQGEYQFGIQQGMRADTLYGIGAVGLRLEKMKD